MWTVASQPPSWPAHSWSVPAASSTSPLMILKMAFVSLSLGPIGLTPGHLSSGIRRHAVNALSPSVLTLVVVIQWPELASAVQRLLEAELKEEQSLLQACASNPEGPGAPWVWRAACLMASASKPIKYDGIDWFMLTIKEGARNSGSLPWGCLSRRTSRVDHSTYPPFCVVSGTNSSNWVHHH